MKTITATEIESLVDVKTILEKQGFKVHTIDTVKEFAEYDVTAVYGDTNEIYAVTVYPIRGTYKVTEKFFKAA